ncbi:MAG: HEPN domain-containing protein [Candidatus Omnitrophota bacterium]
MRKNKDIINEWVEKAEGDYETVLDLRKKRRKRQQYIIAFHCQQCIEKYLKALLASREIEFPKQHDLEELLVLLLQNDPLLSAIRNELKELTPFAVSFRYPGEQITKEEFKRAINNMKYVRGILRERLGLKV